MKTNQLDFSVTSICKRDCPLSSAGLLHAKPWQLGMIGLGTAVTQLDTSVNIAFPAITRGFDLSIGEIQWVVICYVLTYASLLLALGRIGDNFGHALVFRIGLIWSTVALLLVGWSPSFGAMLLFRCLQGIGAALVLSCGAALVTSLYGEERRSHALGIYTMMLSVGLMLGPLLGGALTAAWDWPAVFWFRIPVAVAALLLLRGMPASPQRQAIDRFDILGGVALVLALVTMLLALNRLREFSAIWFALLSAIAFAAFIFRESRAARPIIALEIVRQPGFALLNLVSVLANLAAFSVWLLVPYFLARVPGYSLTEGGVILATAAAGAAVVAPIGGRLAGRRIFRQTIGDRWGRGHWWRSAVARHVDGANPNDPADCRARRAGCRPRPVPACLFGYRDRSTSPKGSRRCRQPCFADANARHCDRRFGCPDGVRNLERETRLPRKLPEDFSVCSLAGIWCSRVVGDFTAQDWGILGAKGLVSACQSTDCGRQSADVRFGPEGDIRFRPPTEAAHVRSIPQIGHRRFYGHTS